MLMKKQPEAAGNLQKHTETGEGEEELSEDDEDTTPESWNRDEEEENEPDDDTIESGETNENEDETYA